MTVLAGCGNGIAPGTSSQRAELAPTDENIPHFGRSIAASGDGSTVVISTRFDEPPTGDTAPAAYVYERAGGTWSRSSLSIPNRGLWSGAFDVSITDDSSTILVGAARFNPPDGTGTGGVFVYERDGESWSRRGTITTPDSDDSNTFGSAVAVSGDGTTALLCTPKSATVFDHGDGEWSRGTTLHIAAEVMSPRRGPAVALSKDGKTALVGGYLYPSPVGPPYVRSRPVEDNSPNESIEAAPRSGETADETTTVASRDTGSFPTASSSRYRGKAVVFERSREEWSRQATFVPGANGRLMGASVALTADGSTALVGVPFTDAYMFDSEYDPMNETTGTVLVFERDGGSWSLETEFTVDEPKAYTSLGESISVSADGSTAIVGNDIPTNTAEAEPVPAYVFARDNEKWSRERSLTLDSDNDEGEYTSVALANGGETTFLSRSGHGYAGRVFVV